MCVYYSEKESAHQVAKRLSSVNITELYESTQNNNNGGKRDPDGMSETSNTNTSVAASVTGTVGVGLNNGGLIRGNTMKPSLMTNNRPLFTINENESNVNSAANSSNLNATTGKTKSESVA